MASEPKWVNSGYIKYVVNSLKLGGLHLTLYNISIHQSTRNLKVYFKCNCLLHFFYQNCVNYMFFMCLFRERTGDITFKRSILINAPGSIHEPGMWKAFIKKLLKMNESYNLIGLRLIRNYMEASEPKWVNPNGF